MVRFDELQNPQGVHPMVKVNCQDRLQAQPLFPVRSGYL